MKFMTSQNIPADLKGPKVNYKGHYGRCTGPLFRLLHDTTPAAVTTNKNIKLVPLRAVNTREF